VSRREVDGVGLGDGGARVRSGRLTKRHERWGLIRSRDRDNKLVILIRPMLFDIVNKNREIYDASDYASMCAVYGLITRSELIGSVWTSS
jgi:hypothetical protein